MLRAIPLGLLIVSPLLPSAPLLAAPEKSAQASAEALFHAGNEKYSRGDFEGAIANYTNALAQSPRTVALYVNRAGARHGNGDLTGAIADLDKAIELNPNLPQAYNNRGRARYEKGDLDDALADFTKAIELDPRYANAHNSRGVVRRDKGDQEGSLADYMKALELDPKNAQAYDNHGISRRETGDIEGALADSTKAIELDPKYPNAYNNRGIARRNKGDLKGALTDYDKAIALNPNYAAAYNNRANIRQTLGDLESALADYAKAIELVPNLAQAYNNRGVIFAVQDQWLKAYHDFDAGCRADTKNLYSALYRYTAQVRLGRAAEAKQALAEAHARHQKGKPGDWPSRLADFLLGKTDEAALFAAAAAKAPETTRQQKCEAWFFAGIKQLGVGQKNEALRCFQECVATEAKELNEFMLAQSELAQGKRKP